MPAFFRRKVEARLVAEARAEARRGGGALGGGGPRGGGPLASGGVTYGPCFTVYRPMKETLCVQGSALMARRGGAALPWLRMPERRTNIAAGAEVTAVEVPPALRGGRAAAEPAAAPADEWAIPGDADGPPARCPSEASSHGSPSPRSSPESVLAGQGVAGDEGAAAGKAPGGSKAPGGRAPGRRGRGRLAASPVRAWFRSSFGRS